MARKAENISAGEVARHMVQLGWELPCDHAALARGLRTAADFVTLHKEAWEGNHMPEVDEARAPHLWCACEGIVTPEETKVRVISYYVSEANNINAPVAVIGLSVNPGEEENGQRAAAELALRIMAGTASVGRSGDWTDLRMFARVDSNAPTPAFLYGLELLPCTESGKPIHGGPLQSPWPFCPVRASVAMVTDPELVDAATARANRLAGLSTPAATRRRVSGRPRDLQRLHGPPSGQEKRRRDPQPYPHAWQQSGYGPERGRLTDSFTPSRPTGRVGVFRFGLYPRKP